MAFASIVVLLFPIQAFTLTTATHVSTFARPTCQWWSHVLGNHATRPRAPHCHMQRQLALPEEAGGHRELQATIDLMHSAPCRDCTTS
jgi:hypothetical protein